MSSTFGAPQVAGAVPDEPTQNGSGGQALDQPVDFIDPNDPALTSEAIDVNTEGDAYAFPPPPPDGKYRVKLKLVQQEDADKKKVDWIAKKHEKHGLYLATAVEATIEDPSGKYDGIHVYDRWVGTFINKDGATKVTTILRLLKQPDGKPWIPAGPGKITHTEWMKIFVRALAGEPEIGIETQWEYSCQACGEEAKKAGKPYPRSTVGMQKFPQDAQKSKPGAPMFLPEMKCSANPAHGYSRAQVRIARFIPLSEVR